MASKHGYAPSEPFYGPGRRGAGTQLHRPVCGYQRQQTGHHGQRAHPSGFWELVKELISVSDVVIENFSSRIMQNWGLGYDELRKLRPDVVYVSMAGFGHVGRHHHYGTMGPAAQAPFRPDVPVRASRRAASSWGWSYLDDTGGCTAQCALSLPCTPENHGQGAAR